MVVFKHPLVVLAGAIPAQANPAPSPSKSCAADRCFTVPALPPSYSNPASSFCQSYIGSTPGTVTKTTTKTTTFTKSFTDPDFVTVTRTQTVTGTPTTSTTTRSTTPDAIVTTKTESATTIVTSGSVCTVTSTVSFKTQVNYASRGVDNLDRRAYPSSKPTIPAPLQTNCPSKGLEGKVSSACSCFLTSKTATKTVTQTTTFVPFPPTPITQTQTITSTLPGSPGTTDVETSVTTLSPTTITTTRTVTATSTDERCTSTTTVFSAKGAFSCGIASPTAGASGTVTCPNEAPAGQTNARLRIEGGDQGTIFEDCIASGPRNVTTPSGGNHHCDGTNLNANPNPGATLTTQLDAAARREGFGFDATYSSQFQDFFITAIDATAENSKQFWAALLNLDFIPVGGCQQLIVNGDEGLWAFDGFSVDVLLSVEPGYRVVTAGKVSSVTLTISGSDGSGGKRPVPGASINGVTSDANGKLQLPVPSTPGCYQYKAFRSDSIRSNAFYLTVLPASG